MSKKKEKIEKPADDAQPVVPGALPELPEDDAPEPTPSPREVRDQIAALEMKPREGSAKDRFKVIAPVAFTRSVTAGVVFREGIGFTGSVKTMNIFRGLGYQVIDQTQAVAKPGGASSTPSTPSVSSDQKE